MGYAESVGKLLVGKQVEILTGDQYDTLEYAETSKSRSSAVFGKLIGGDDDLLVVEVMVDDRMNVLYINTSSVNSICEPSSGMSLWDMYVCTERKMVK